MSEDSAPKDQHQEEKGESGKVTKSPTEKDQKWDRERIVNFTKKNALLLSLIASMILGIILGGCLRLVDPPLTFRQRLYLRFPGEIFMNMLKLIILPLIVTSLIAGVTSLDAKASGKIGLRAIVYYMTTMLMAVILGIILVLIIRPGDKGSKPDMKKMEVTRKEVVDIFMDLVRQLVPNNIVEASFRKQLTKLVEVEVTGKNESAENDTEVELRPTLGYVHGTNMLGVLVFSIAIAIAINSLGQRAQPVKELVSVLCDATLVLVGLIMWYSPIGVLFLVAAEIVKMGDPGTVFIQLGFYFVTVMLGLIIHGGFVLPTLYYLMVRRNPVRYMTGILEALITALGTSSSSATIPVTLKNLEENNHVDPRVTAFVIPVGATINMDGTALYEAVAVIFIGQVNGIELSLGNVITICIMATAAAVGAAGIPSAGLVTMVMVLTAVGFPSDGIGMIWAIDWLLDRFRTVVNVTGDAIGAGIVDYYSQDDLRYISQSHEQARPSGDVETQTTNDLLRTIHGSGSTL